jgi:hypothetical protein
VNVTANSSIDVSGALAASLGNLNISGSTLSVTSANTSSSAYSLGFGATAISGASTIDVANSAGGGSGVMQLGAVSGSGSLTKADVGTLKLAGGGTIGGGLILNGGTLEVDGNTSIAGTFTGNSTGTLNIVGGKLSLAAHAVGADATTTNLESLNISAGGKLDLANNNLVIDYGAGADPLAQIISDLTAGFDNGKWDGNGAGSGAIFSTAIAAKPGTSLGYLDVGEEIEIKYTWLGDLNFDGQVDDTDLQMLNVGLAKPTGSSVYWNDGDLNYDGVINADDFALFQLGVARQDNSIGAGVPEPGGMAVVLGMGLMVWRRRGVRR